MGTASSSRRRRSRRRSPSWWPGPGSGTAMTTSETRIRVRSQRGAARPEWEPSGSDWIGAPSMGSRAAGASAPPFSLLHESGRPLRGRARSQVEDIDLELVEPRGQGLDRGAHELAAERTGVFLLPRRFECRLCTRPWLSLLRDAAHQVPIAEMRAPIRADGKMPDLEVDGEGARPPEPVIEVGLDTHGAIGLGYGQGTAHHYEVAQ